MIFAPSVAQDQIPMEVMNRRTDVLEAVKLITKHVNFDVDTRVSLFEINIRVMGGLLSSHILIERNPELAKNYKGEFLRKAIDLADRLLPAFNTTSGIPIAWINLRKGVLPEESREACVAGAGTLILEFGTLSQLSGDRVYGQVAKTAMKALYDARSSLGLFGNTIDSELALWMRRDSGIGAGIDSFFEYLLKAYLLFGDEDYLEMFTDVYSAAMFHMLMPRKINGYQWIFDADIEFGHLTRPWISSLSAFWPGMQALVGQEEHGENMHANFTNIFLKFRGLPELFSLDGTMRHPEQPGYPLRPELIESTYILHSLTGNPHYLEVGQCLHSAVKAMDTKRCGYAHVKDVATGELEDGMESFFLSETSKYLYLLFSNATSLLDFFVFTTEAHLLPPVPNHTSDIVQDDVPSTCERFCSELTQEEMAQAQADISIKFPLLKVNDGDRLLIRQRRCHACAVITDRMDTLPRRDPEEHFRRMRTHPITTGEGFTQCVWELRDGGPHCILISPQPSHDLSETLLGKNMQGPLSHVLLNEGYLLVDNGDSFVEGYVTMASFGPSLEQSMRLFKLGNEPQTCPRKELFFESAELPENLKDPNQVNEGFEDLQTCPNHVMSTNKYSQPSTPIMQGRLVQTLPDDACTTIENPADMVGAVALVHRGGCSFSHKARIVEEAGAIGVIVVNNEGTHTTVVMGMSSNLPVPGIASGMISRSCGQKLTGQALGGWYPTCVLAESKQKVASLSRVLSARFQELLSAKDHEANRADDMMVFSCSD